MIRDISRRLAEAERRYLRGSVVVGLAATWMVGGLSSIDVIMLGSVGVCYVLIGLVVLRA